MITREEIDVIINGKYENLPNHSKDQEVAAKIINIGKILQQMPVSIAT